MAARQSARRIDASASAKVGRDFRYQLACCLRGVGRVVVTREASSPKKQRANHKLPDVCMTMGVLWIDDVELWRQLDFRAG